MEDKEKNATCIIYTYERFIKNQEAFEEMQERNKKDLYNIEGGLSNNK